MTGKKDCAVRQTVPYSHTYLPGATNQPANRKQADSKQHVLNPFCFDRCPKASGSALFSPFFCIYMCRSQTQAHTLPKAAPGTTTASLASNWESISAFTAIEMIKMPVRMARR